MRERQKEVWPAFIAWAIHTCWTVTQITLPGPLYLCGTEMVPVPLVCCQPHSTASSSKCAVKGGVLKSTGVAARKVYIVPGHTTVAAFISQYCDTLKLEFSRALALCASWPAFTYTWAGQLWVWLIGVASTKATFVASSFCHCCSIPGQAKPVFFAVYDSLVAVIAVLVSPDQAISVLVTTATDEQICEILVLQQFNVHVQ